MINPADQYNEKLINQVHPPNWQNPQPAEMYDLVVIGAGTAGLVVAAGAAGLGIGLKVALVEKYLMGGDCLNFGCVPSKTLIRSARIMGEINRAKDFGININAPQVDFEAVMERLRKIRANISENDSAQRLQNLGVDVFFGNGYFSSDHTVNVGEKILRFKKAVIATGARANHPDIPGLKETGFLTNETVFALTTLPKRLAVIGGGPIGCELAQAFARLGSEVIILQRGDSLLPREDREASALLANLFYQDNIKMNFHSQIERVSNHQAEKTLYLADSQEITVDEILVASGRSPNIEGLNLETVGAAYNQKGVKVNNYLQTTNPRIYAAGDICLDWKFTHTADAAARIVIKNALFSPFGLGKAKLTDLVIPWVTYTDPEIAHVGLSTSQAEAQGIKYQTIKVDLTKVDRAIADGSEKGFIKIIHKQGSDQILGATIVASHAGEMISEITLAMVSKLGLNTLSQVIHPYPTQAECMKKAADAYRRSLLTDRSHQFLRLLKYFAG
jgi:pyruvate/2-oxoglutarate dehydrogenase complex dihydrolipoamide dehydrogenase (E3) component